jgi:hypothetical protein
MTITPAHYGVSAPFVGTLLQSYLRTDNITRYVAADAA